MEYICKHCNKGYASYQSRCNHIRRYHKSKLSIDKPETKNDDKSIDKPNISMKNKENLDEYKCKNCYKTYRHFQSRWKHQQTCKNINIKSSDNELEEIVKNNKLHSKTKFLRLDSTQITDFPKLHLNELKTRITFGELVLNI